MHSNYSSLSHSNNIQGMVNLSIVVLIGLSSIALAGPPFRRLTQKFFDFLSEHSTAYEQADRIVDVLCAEYPEPFCETVEDRIFLKRELIHFYASEKEERNEVMAGFPSKYKAIPAAIRKLQELAKELFPTLDEKHKWIKNEKHLMMHLFMKPLYQFAVEKQKKHKGWSKEEIRKDVVANQRRLMEVFHKDDPDQRLVERANARLRRRNEL